MKINLKFFDCHKSNINNYHHHHHHKCIYDIFIYGIKTLALFLLFRKNHMYICGYHITNIISHTLWFKNVFLRFDFVKCFPFDLFISNLFFLLSFIRMVFSNSRDLKIYKIDVHIFEWEKEKLFIRHSCSWRHLH